MLILVCAWIHFGTLSNTETRIIAISVVALLSDVLVVVFFSQYWKRISDIS